VTVSFEDFFAGVHGYRPFPWQSEFAHRLLTADVDQVDVPTAAGKSAVVEAHLWAAAMSERPRRRLFVVQNRRVLVDQISSRAEKALEAMLDPDAADAVRAVAERLWAMSERLPTDETPFDVHSLRGGLATGNSWVRRLDRVAIISTTPDQAGSSLLHRPYLLSMSAAPMAAAMWCDAYAVMDEAHLSPALVGLFDGVSDVWGGEDEIEWGQPPHPIFMSATLGRADGRRVSLSDDDLAHEALRRRLFTPRLVSCDPSEMSKSVDAAIVEAHVRRWLDESDGKMDDPRCVLVVVNTVEDAVSVSTRLAKTADTVRITSRQSTTQRDLALQKIYPFLSGHNRNEAHGDLIVVATQTVECGVDLDADFLITAACPVAELLQRLGRLNRTGRLDEAHAVVVLGGSGLYGDSAEAVVEFLRRLDAPVDMCPAQLGSLDLPVQEVSSLTLLRPTSALVDVWASNLPSEACADLAPFIHGVPLDHQLDVYMATRSALDDLRLSDSEAAQEFCRKVAEEHPPHPDEFIRVPLSAARAMSRAIHLRCGADGVWEIVEADKIKPNDRVIVGVKASSAYFDEFGWRKSGGKGWRDNHFDPDSIASDDFEEHRIPVPVGLDGQPVVGTDQNELSEVVVYRRTKRPPALPDEFSSPLSLEDHLADVGGLAERFASACGLPDDLRFSTMHGGAMHDLGKADPRFQQILDPTFDGSTPPLAKGIGTNLTPSQRRERQEASGLPSGWRHEAYQIDPRYEDRQHDLLNWVIATHHGRGRPLWPACDDAEVPLQGSFSDDWTTVRRTLIDRYGPWRLAFLESIVRTADWAGSALREKGLTP
jgi:CRISPR-associated endonuclease/helicase Cas3